MGFERLGSNPEFKRVYKKGRSKADKNLVMYVVKGQTGPTRYGFSVSKKVGNSVQRHRITRRFREICRRYDAFIEEGLRIVIVARPSVKDKGFDEISDSIKHLYKTHGVWKES